MTKTNGAEDIRLVRIEGENVRILKLAAVRLDGEPGLFRVTGENEAGKTTFLDLVAMLFGGKKAVKPDTIQEGADGAWCRAELSNGYSIERRFTRAAPDGYLTVTTPDDATPRSPQTLLDGWCGPHSFDPGALLAKRSSEIEDIILSLAKRPGLKEELAELVAEREELRERRTPYNRVVQRAQRMDRPEGDRPEPVDVSGEMARLKELRAVQNARAEKRRAWDEAGKTWDAAVQAVDDHKERIAALEAELARMKEDLPEFERIADQADAKVQATGKDYADAPDPTEDIEAVEARISEADAVNEALEPWREWDRAKAEEEEAKAEADELSKLMAEVDRRKDELLRSSEIPVSGVTFDAEGAMLLNDHPINVASGRRKHDMAFDIAEAANPRVKVVLLDEANDYDLPSLAKLDERARKRGWQVLACRIGIEGPGEIVVVDGRATNQGAEDEAEAEDVEAEVAEV